jgi:acylphosphatase
MEDDNKDEMLETRLVRVRGRVQGIGYREACVHHARALGVTGWVRNRMDDSVEAMLQGSPQQLEDMCTWLNGRYLLRGRSDGRDVDVANLSQLGANGAFIECLKRYRDECLDPMFYLLKNLLECSALRFIRAFHSSGVIESPVR